MKSVALLTNTNDADALEEDSLLAEQLKKHFRVEVFHPLQFLTERRFDIVLVRNIWPTDPHRKEYLQLYERWRKEGQKVYNDFSGKGDMQGKNYLAELYAAGYPVIPTVESAQDLAELAYKDYLLKPIYGGSSTGIKKVSAVEIKTETVDGYIIQPYINIEYELSLYYIDKQLQYALKTQDSRWDLTLYEPSAEEIEIAQTFIDWNSLKYGITRIDLCKTKDGHVLLMEIEDWCPYLSLFDVPAETQKKFIDNLVISLESALLQ